MTEKEYIEAIKKVAEDYRKEIANCMPPSPFSDTYWQAQRRWFQMASHLSVSTAIALCEAWLEKHTENGA